MRRTIFGLLAALAAMTAGAAPAVACGGGLFQGSCAPCGQAYVGPCAQAQIYQPPVYSGCGNCGGWGYERLADPATQYYPRPPMQHQYYYVNQGPTYSGPGDFAPYRTYHEEAYGPRVYGYRTHHHHYRYGYREHVLRRYY